MNRLQKLLVISFLSVGAYAVPLTYAQAPNEGQGQEPGKTAEHQGHMGKHRGQWKEKREEKMKELFKQLNLSDDQQKQLDVNKAKNSEQRKASFEKIRSSREALTQELMKPDLDMTKVNAIQAQIKQLNSDQIDNRLSSILEVRKILTPEQFSKFLTAMEKHRHERFGKDKDTE